MTFGTPEFNAALDADHVYNETNAFFWPSRGDKQEPGYGDYKAAEGVAFNSLALTDNDQEPGIPVDIRQLFLQKVTDVAKVELRQYHIGGGLFHDRLEWQDPISDERVPGLDSLLR